MHAHTHIPILSVLKVKLELLLNLRFPMAYFVIVPPSRGSWGSGHIHTPLLSPLIPSTSNPKDQTTPHGVSRRLVLTGANPLGLLQFSDS